MIKILSLPVGRDGCSFYRVRKPLEGLKTHTNASPFLIETDKPETISEAIKLIPHADIILMRPGAEQARDKLLSIPEIRDSIRAKWVMDLDDNLEMVSPYSEFYRHNGTAEFIHDGKKIWEDGKNGFNIGRNKQKIEEHINGLRRADLVTVTTPALAKYVSQYNPNVYINDNVIDFNCWWPINHKKNKKVRIIWAGSPSHYEDFYPIKDQINNILRQEDVELYMVGSSYPGIFKGVEDKVINLPWVDSYAHSYRLMSLCADIAIIPLADNLFNRQKSAIKFYEFSAMGVPSVVSNVPPYADVIKHGNALPYDNAEQFESHLTSLINDQTRRAKIGKKAYNWVYKNKNLEIESQKLVKRFEELCQTQS